MISVYSHADGVGYERSIFSEEQIVRLLAAEGGKEIFDSYLQYSINSKAKVAERCKSMR